MVFAFVVHYSGHSAGARLYHNNTNWQLSYRLIGYPNGPNVCTRYDIICGTNAIMTFKGKWWAQWSSRVYVACISLKVMVGPNTQQQRCDPEIHINGREKSQILQSITFKFQQKQNNQKKTHGFRVNFSGKYRVCVQVNIQEKSVIFGGSVGCRQINWWVNGLNKYVPHM